MNSRLQTLLVTALLVCVSAVGTLAQDATPDAVDGATSAAKTATPATKYAAGEGEIAFGARASSSVRPDFGSYVFWAYGLTCVLLFAFTLYTLVGTRKVDERTKYLQERFARAHPDEAASS